MGKQCTKCGYIQPERPGGYEPECPKCGADYVTGLVATAVSLPPGNAANAGSAIDEPAGQKRPVPRFQLSEPAQAGPGMVISAIIVVISTIAALWNLLAGTAMLFGIYMLILTVAIVGMTITQGVTRATNSVRTALLNLANSMSPH